MDPDQGKNTGSGSGSETLILVRLGEINNRDRNLKYSQALNQLTASHNAAKVITLTHYFIFNIKKGI